VEVEVRMNSGRIRTDGAAARMRRHVIAIGAAAAVVLAGCGSSSPKPSDLAPKDVLLTAAHLASGTSLRMAMSADETFTIAGNVTPALGSLNGRSITLTMQLEAQNSQQARGTLAVNLGGQSTQVVTVVYGGAVYVSKDNGTSFENVPLNGSPTTQYGPDNALQYLESVSTVTDNGPGTADGVAVEKYHAQLDGAKVLNVIKSAMSTLQSSSFQRILSSLRFTGGALDASIDHTGRIVHESGIMDAALDLGQIDPSESGDTMSIHLNVDARFYDYGATITVNRPGNVTGTLTLP
jgi:hypothetical protein